jgi:hypothetical protein
MAVLYTPYELLINIVPDEVTVSGGLSNSLQGNQSFTGIV